MAAKTCEQTPVRLDFRRSLGPPQEETAGRVSGLAVSVTQIENLIYASEM